MIRFLVIRHGETEWNSAGRIQGQLESPLNVRGKEQAQAIARRLATERIDEIWSSDLARAKDTALFIAQHHDAVLRYDARLRERHFGAWQGLTFAQVSARHPHEHARYLASDPDFAMTGGESTRAFFQRATEFLQQRAAATSAPATIALVTHGGVVSCYYRHTNAIALGQPRTWNLPNAALNEFVFERGAWRMANFADVSHLDEALDDV